MDTNLEMNTILEDAETNATVGCISSSVESGVEARLAAIEARLIAAEARLAEKLTELKAAAEKAPVSVANTRKTLPVEMTGLLAKQGVSLDSLDAGALDAALSSLSIEQRIAVKSQLLRAGLLNVAG
ncbi:MAG: hypothetical protein FWD64_09290 [Acidobacteriaceae bacterium]|nr:hypothetical protein [Acidobacteriaceae bacterium]